MKAFIFPGQGSQFIGMGKALYQQNSQARALFDAADELLGYSLTQVMFGDNEQTLRQTQFTQPAIFTYSVVAAKCHDSFFPDMVAGHSLGEISALVAIGCLSFASGLNLVKQRAMAMERACKRQKSGMMAVLGLEDDVVNQVCQQAIEKVVPANFNCPGQVVVSGTIEDLDVIQKIFVKAGARRVIPLSVGGAFHSYLMEEAKNTLSPIIEKIEFKKPVCPIYQNVVPEPNMNPEKIKENLINQITAPVPWTAIINNMIRDKGQTFIELPPGKVLQGLVKKINRAVAVLPLTNH